MVRAGAGLFSPVNVPFWYEVPMSTSLLDDSIAPAVQALHDRHVPVPQVLLWTGTGAGMLPRSLANNVSVPLGRLPGVPASWHDSVLHAGSVDELCVWILDDAPRELNTPGSEVPDTPAWARGYPAWLAAAAGAVLCIHTSAGSVLPPGDTDGTPLAPGTLFFPTDHINLSGHTPLSAMGETGLGPLFPDQTTLHHHGLRAVALERCASIGLPCAEGIVACSLGPALETPAERRWMATAGAAVSVQGLASPFHACAHAGLSLLSIIVLTDDGSRPMDMAALVEASEAAAPGLEDLLGHLLADVTVAVNDIMEEEA